MQTDSVCEEPSNGQSRTRASRNAVTAWNRTQSFRLDSAHTEMLNRCTVRMTKQNSRLCY